MIAISTVRTCGTSLDFPPGNWFLPWLSARFTACSDGPEGPGCVWKLKGWLPSLWSFVGNKLGKTIAKLSNFRVPLYFQRNPDGQKGNNRNTSIFSEWNSAFPVIRFSLKIHWVLQNMEEHVIKCHKMFCTQSTLCYLRFLDFVVSCNPIWSPNCMQMHRCVHYLLCSSQHWNWNKYVRTYATPRT